MTLTPKLAFLSKPWFYLTFLLGLVLIVGLLGAPSFPTDVAAAGKLANRQPWPLGEGDLHRSSRGGHGRLVVLLHGFGWYGHASMRRFKEVIQELEPEADIWIPPLPLRPGDFADPEVAAEELVLRLNQLNQAHSYEWITLVGHSSGAVFARKLWVLAHGARFDGTVELGRFASWPARIDRIVLLAGMNRGWSVASAMGVSARINFAAGAMLGHLISAVSYGRLEPSIFGLRRGAPFLTRMRLQWLAVERALDGGAALGAGAQPLTVQIVGTRDDLVAPTDHIDRASGADFHYVEVVESTHANILDVDRAQLDRSHPNRCGDPDSDVPAAAHAARVCLALIGTTEEIGRVEVDRREMLRFARETPIDSRLPLPDGAGITDTVFVVHGIRDPGYWARRIAIQLTKGAKDIADGRTFEAFADSYGYFPMVPFIMPWARRAKVEWLLDLLVSRISDQPGSRLHYIGHSNGTYLLGMALKVLPMRQLRFERVVMAGSVLPSGYAWPVTPDGAGIGCVVNYVATADWVVAVFPNGISVGERVGELGAAGHQGFGGEPDRGGVRSAGPGVWNVRWVEGSHAAALQQGRWDEIVRFVTAATDPCANPDALGRTMLAADPGRPSALWRVMGFVSPVLVVLLFLVVTVVGWAILDPLTWRDRARAALFVGWIAVVLLVAFQL